ncbi:MAG: YggS family pyridoxal phosphate enzyme [Planctomycetes bacterium GWF2_42_9]|nr:MAG: YggS family pyridoxal phosphate enzyme [Planctomycetes bacterium GWF2_42_9]HAL44316.1 YggS family pyridoxal phosphate-dependent enzyme [Phycisphaerales bacterium]
MNKIADNLKRVQDNIAAACQRCGRQTSEITTVVVTKSANIDMIKEVVRLGCTDLGENRVQHLKITAEDLDIFLSQNANNPNIPKQITWHMIGHLQRNKVRQLLRNCQIIHSVDTLRVAEEVSRDAEKALVTPKILMQVNCSQEPQKYGVPVGAAVHLAEQIVTMPNIKLVGLMTMAPLTLDIDIVKESFARARELFEEIKGEKIAGPEFNQLSMGMSQDYEIAIEYGATILRIGSAIFS